MTVTRMHCLHMYVVVKEEIQSIKVKKNEQLHDSGNHFNIAEKKEEMASSPH